MLLSLSLKFLLGRLCERVPLSVVIIIVQALKLMGGFHKQRPEAVFLPEIPSHMNRLHIHQILDFLQPFVGHAGTFFD